MTGRYGEGEVERRLLAYASVRLAPDPRSMARVRAVVLAAAGTVAGDSVGSGPTLTGTGAAITTLRRRRTRLGWATRARVSLLAAVVATLVIAGAAAAASRAGGPLYGARIWFETLTLPTEPAARTDAELRRLATRLREAQDASAQGDSNAARSAVEAYDTTVDEALDAAQDDGALTSMIDLELRRHIVVLQGLEAVLPAGASEALSRVIARGELTIQRIESNQAGGNAGGNGGNNGNAGGNGGGAGGPTATGNGGGGAGGGNGAGASGSPNAPPSHPPKPSHTPKPTSTDTQADPGASGHGGGASPSPHASAHAGP